jgi:hypothetical protein
MVILFDDVTLVDHHDEIHIPGFRAAEVVTADSANPPYLYKNFNPKGARKLSTWFIGCRDSEIRLALQLEYLSHRRIPVSKTLHKLDNRVTSPWHFCAQTQLPYLLRSTNLNNTKKGMKWRKKKVL